MGEQAEQRWPERIPRLEPASTVRDVTNHRFTAFQNGETGDFFWSAILGTEHRGAQPQGLRMITECGIQESDGKFRVREFLKGDLESRRRLCALVIVTPSLDREPLKLLGPQPQPPGLVQQGGEVGGHPQFGGKGRWFGHSPTMPQEAREVNPIARDA